MSILKPVYLNLHVLVHIIHNLVSAPEYCICYHDYTNLLICKTL